MKPFTESMLNQCRKYMFNFFDYLPTKYQASARDWQVRKFVWAFKDGRCADSAAQLVAKKIREQFGTSASDMVFVCIPASSQRKNEIRYIILYDNRNVLFWWYFAYHVEFADDNQENF